MTQTSIQKEKVPLKNISYTYDYINIETDCTCFSRRKRVNYPCIKQLEKEVKSLRKELKTKGVKLNRTNTLKLLRENKQEYNDMVKLYNDTFTQLSESWKHKIENEGFYYGFLNDPYYINHLKKLEFDLQKMNNRTNILSQVLEIKNKVQRIKDDLLNGTEFISISI